MTNNIIIKTPINESFNYGTSVVLSFEVKNPDKNFHKVQFFLNDDLIYNENAFLGIFNIVPKSGLNQIRAVCVNKANKIILNTDVEVYFNNITDKIEKENQLSKLIKYQLPEFIQTEYPKFIDFIQSYYEFLETTNNINYIPYNLEQYKNPDNCPSYIFNTLKSEFMSDFGVNLSRDRQTNLNLNESNILKNIKQFYDSKGTVDSIKFLFRILYDAEIEIKYPRDEVLRPSDGSYVTKNTIKCYLKNFNFIKYIKAAKIYQYNDNDSVVASCYATHQTVRKQNGIYVADIEVNQIIGTFDISKPIYIKNIIDGAEIKDFPLEVIPQTDYDINYSIYDLDGTGLIDGGDIGTLLISFGPTTPATSLHDFNKDGQINYDDLAMLYEEYGNQAQDIDTPIENSVIKRSIYKIPFNRRSYGYWAKTNSLLSTGNVLPDNIYYHDYSYVVNGKISEKKYLNIVKKLGHPAGFSIFGSYSAKTKILFDSQITGVPAHITSSLLLGNYAAYTFETKQDLNDIQIYSDIPGYRAYPDGYKIGSDGRSEDISTEYEAYILQNEQNAKISKRDLVVYDGGAGIPLEPDAQPPHLAPINDRVYKQAVNGIKIKYLFGQFTEQDISTTTDNPIKPINKYWAVGIHPNKLIPSINNDTPFGELKLQDVLNLGIIAGNTNNAES
jgi:hypothetical protein